MRCSEPGHRAPVAIRAPLVGRVAELGSLDHFIRMSDTAPTDSTKAEHGSRASVTLDAILVPVLVVIIQAVYAATGNGFRNAFLSGIFHPVILLSMAGVALISFFALCPFARQKTARRVVFFLCVAVFTGVALFLTPAIVE